VKNPPLSTADGLWLAPGSVEWWGDPPRWDPFVDVSADGGRSWTRSPIPVDHDAVPGAGLIQPALWWGRSGPVALLRGTAGRAYRASSPDGGRTWTPAQPTELPNNNSGLAALALPGGRVVCAYNPVAESWGPRCPLVLAVSDDDGLSWRTVRTIEDGVSPVDPAVPRVRPAPADVPRRIAAGAQRSGFAAADTGVLTSGAGEYSYPAMALDGDQLLVSYTWQRRGIVLARLPLDELTD
jgi:predicted neuraminidase